MTDETVGLMVWQPDSEGKPFRMVAHVALYGEEHVDSLVQAFMDRGYIVHPIVRARLQEPWDSNQSPT